MRALVLCSLLPLLAVAVAACRAEAPAHQPSGAATLTTPVTIASASSPSAPIPPPATASPCGALQAIVALRKDATFLCEPTFHGAWALTVAPSGTVSVLHVVGSEPPAERVVGDLGDNAGSFIAPGKVQAFDFDGDGEPELFARASIAGLDERVLVRTVLTAHHGTIEPYAPATAYVVEGLRDVDGDGRPDLDVVFELGGFKGCDYCAGDAWEEPYVAHALADGSFSLTDAVARREAAARCKDPIGPRFITPATETISERAVLCARLQGRSRATVQAALTRECAPFAGQTKACQGPCKYVERLLSLAAFEPPLHLGATR